PVPRRTSPVTWSRCWTCWRSSWCCCACSPRCTCPRGPSRCASARSSRTAHCTRPPWSAPATGRAPILRSWARAGWTTSPGSPRSRPSPATSPAISNSSAAAPLDPPRTARPPVPRRRPPRPRHPHPAPRTQRPAPAEDPIHVNDDYYDLLSVDREASADEIKKAYRNLARALNPDVNPDPDAAEKFKRVSQAYETLSNADKRRQYDM